MFKKLNNDLLESIGTSLASSITTQNSMLQQLLESSQTKAIECAKHGANQILIPSIDAICAQLFLQLNDTFSQGLQQFMNQMTSHHQRATPVVSGIPSSVLGASTGPSDQQIILQLLQQNQQGKAIDVALSRHDSSTLMFLFSKVNMDDLFTKAPLMPPSKLLVMLQILSKRIDSDTELKFRYILDILISLNRHYKNCLDEQVVLVLDQLNSAVKGYQNFMVISHSFI
jgi:hypothetical protein